MHSIVALREKEHPTLPLFFRFQQLSPLRAMLLHLDLSSSHNTPALQLYPLPVWRSGADSFQPGRRPRTPESRDPGRPEGDRRLCLSSRLQSRHGQTRPRLKTETNGVFWATVGAQCSLARLCPNATVDMHAMAMAASIQQVTAGRRRAHPTPTEWIPGPNLSTRPSCHQSPHGHLQSANLAHLANIPISAWRPNGCAY